MTIGQGSISSGARRMSRPNIQSVGKTVHYGRYDKLSDSETAVLREQAVMLEKMGDVSGSVIVLRNMTRLIGRWA